nr:hypothetical protein Iba_chr15bCG8390 [Ipomoea batatas]
MGSLDDLENMRGIGDFECMKGSVHLECMGHISHFEEIVSSEFVQSKSYEGRHFVNRNFVVEHDDILLGICLLFRYLQLIFFLPSQLASSKSVVLLQTLLLLEAFQLLHLIYKLVKLPFLTSLGSIPMAAKVEIPY